MIPFRRDYFTLVSPHPPEECARRLQAVTANPTRALGLAALLSDKPLSGEVSETDIYLAKRNNFGNALQPVFVATLEQYGSGTRLDCCIRLPILSSILLCLFVTAFPLVGLVLIAQSLRDIEDGRVDVRELGSGIFAIIFVASFIWYGRSLARGDTEFVTEHVTRQLEAWHA